MIPQTLFVVLGITYASAASMGMSGCSIQLNSEKEISWSDTMILFDHSRREVKTFLRLQSAGFTRTVTGNMLRVSIPEAIEYFNKYSTIQVYLDSYDRNRHLRLGSRASLDPWDLNNRDSFILRMSDDDFNRHYISDPRNRVTTAEAIRGLTLHSPVLRGANPDGLPDPGIRGWI